MARPKQAILTRERIGLAAIQLIDDGHDLQITPLAKKLGVSASSLYHHVRGRTDIIHTMREALAAQHPVTPAPPGPWQDQIRHNLGRLWISYAEHPRVLPYLLSTPIDEPVVLQHYADLADSLRAAQVPEADLLLTVEALDAFAMGAALDSLSPDLTFVSDSPENAIHPLIVGHPSGTARTQRVYDIGLTLMLRGIESSRPA